MFNPGPFSIAMLVFPRLSYSNLPYMIDRQVCTLTGCSTNHSPMTSVATVVFLQQEVLSELRGQ